MSGPDGAIHPALHPLKEALAGTDSPAAALRWLAKAPVATVLADIASGRRQGDGDSGTAHRGVIDHDCSIVLFDDRLS